jgi:hypothetical protein
MKFKLIPATDKVHKWVGIFIDDEGKETKVPFGQYGASDYTIHKNKLRRENYLNRHRPREDWNNPMTAGALSKMILWGNSTNLQTNVREFKDKFHLD